MWTFIHPTTGNCLSIVHDISLQWAKPFLNFLYMYAMNANIVQTAAVDFICSASRLLTVKKRLHYSNEKKRKKMICRWSLRAWAVFLLILFPYDMLAYCFDHNWWIFSHIGIISSLKYIDDSAKRMRTA